MLIIAVFLIASKPRRDLFLPCSIATSLLTSHTERFVVS